MQYINCIGMASIHSHVYDTLCVETLAFDISSHTGESIF